MRARSIHKYTMDSPVFVAGVPGCGRVLTVATQDGNPCVWVEVTPSARIEPRTFVAVPTGGLIGPGDTYVGTAHDVAGQDLVMHIYERTA